MRGSRRRFTIGLASGGLASGLAASFGVPHRPALGQKIWVSNLARSFDRLHSLLVQRENEILFAEAGGQGLTGRRTSNPARKVSLPFCSVSRSIAEIPSVRSRLADVALASCRQAPTRRSKR